MTHKEPDADARQRLWKALSVLFAEDDGSLPEVRIVGVSSAGGAAMFDELRKRAEPLTPTQTVWHDRLDREVPLSEVPDAGLLAASGELTTLHVVLRGLEAGGVRVPDLGVSVWPGEVALDYRMGSDWNPSSLGAFAVLLGELLRLDAGARLDLEDYVFDDLRDRFRAEVSRYLGRSA